MKNQFFEHFGYSDEQKKEIWNDCIFTFDTNVLLNMYRYSEETKKKFFDIFNNTQNKIWLTNTVVNEFFKNRLNVLRKIIKERYGEIIEIIDKIDENSKKIEKEKIHEYQPIIDEELYSKYNDAKNKLRKNIIEQQNIYFERVNNDKDDILQELGEYFNGKVEKGFTLDEIKNKFKEGKKRYDDFIPPGYEDIKKIENKEKEDDYTFEEKFAKYGDFIIWEEIIKKSIDENCPMIFITDEKKEDWWLQKVGKTIQPRPELIKEFWQRTQNNFYMYKPEVFLEYATEDFLNDKLEEKIYDEVQNVDSTIDKIYDFSETLNLSSRQEDISKAEDVLKGDDKLYSNILFHDVENIPKIYNIKNKISDNEYAVLKLIDYMEVITIKRLMNKMTRLDFKEEDAISIINNLLAFEVIHAKDSQYIQMTKLGKQVLEKIESTY